MAWEVVYAHWCRQTRLNLIHVSRPVRMCCVAFQSMSWLGTAKLVSTQQEQKGVDEEGSLDTEDTEESKLEVCMYARERWQG